MPENTTKLAYSIAEAAEQVCVSPSTIRREIDAGRLAVRYVGANPRIKHSELDAWFDALPSERL